MKLSSKQTQILKSYARGFVAVVIPMYMSGVHDWKVLAYAGAAAVIPPALRAMDKNDPAFGLVAEVAQEVLVKKAPAKKAPVKKTVSKKKA